MADSIGVVVTCAAGPGVLHDLSGVIAAHSGDITSVDIMESQPPTSRIYFEIDLPGDRDALLRDLRAREIVRDVEAVESLKRIYGKRIITMGGGAQVGQVAIGAISEADRHNIRGEHISVDTIP